MDDRDQTHEQLLAEVHALRRQVAQQHEALQQAEAELGEQRLRYRELVEDSIQGLYIHQDGVIQFANRVFAEMFGYDSPEALVGLSYLTVVAPHERARLSAYRNARLRREPAARRYECQGQRRDGALIWLECMPTLILWRGRPAVLATFLDITERKRAEAERAVRLRQLQTIRDVAEEITRELDLDVLLDLIVRRTVELVGVATSTIRLWDDSQQALITAATYGGQTDLSPIPIKLGEGIIGVAAQRREGLAANIYRDSPYAHPAMTARVGTGSMIAEPLLYRDRLIGVILGIRWQSEPFTAADRGMLGLFAAEAAIAIENARLFHESQRREAWLSGILGVNKRIAASADLNALITSITEEACRLIQATGARVGICREAHIVFDASARYGAVPDHTVIIPLEGSLLGRVVREDRAAIVADVPNSSEILPVYKQRFAQAGIRSIIFVPIRGPCEVRGVLYVSSQTRREFTAEEAQALTTYAEQAALAMEQAQLIDAVQQRQAALEGANATLRSEIEARRQAEDEVRRLNAQLEQRVAERTAQLEATNRELEAFSYSVSHDLRAPLRAIDGFSRILLEDYAPQCDAEAQRYLSMIGESTQRMGELIEDLLTFSRVGRRPLSKRWMAVDDLARQALEELHYAYAGRQVDVAVGALPACQADPILLKQVLVNLLANALKFTRQRQAARVEVGWCEAHSAYFVRDNGVGFDMRYAAKLFVAFQRLHSQEDYEGTGVGLSLAQRIVCRHGGRIWAEAAVDRGATFYFTLPGENAYD